LKFAPSTSTLVYTEFAGTAAGVPVAERVFLGPAFLSEQVVWFPADDPGARRSFTYQSRLVGLYGPAEGLSTEFLPDGQRIALFGQSKNVVLDLQTGNVQALNLGELGYGWPNGWAHAWRSGDEFVYSAEWRHLRNGEPWFIREIYRQKIGAPASRRAMVFREEAAMLGSLHFSSDGRYAFVRGAPFTDQAHRLLDTSTGGIREIDLPAEAHAVRSVVDAAWKPDSSTLAIVCQLQTPMNKDPCGTGAREVLFVFEPATVGQGQRAEHRMVLPSMAQAGWTAEGDSLVVDAGEDFKALICPEPWTVTPLAAAVAGVKIEGLDHPRWTVHPFLPGCMLLQNSAGIGRVAADYGLKSVTWLSNEMEWACSNDGRYVAEVREERQGQQSVVLRTLNPPLRATAAGSRPAGASHAQETP
jgi:hypothetical protein